VTLLSFHPITGAFFPVPLKMDDGVLDQNNPVSGTQYIVLDTILYGIIEGISVKCTWTVQPTPLRIIVTIDGQDKYHKKINPVSNTLYYAQRNAGVSRWNQTLNDTLEYFAFLYLSLIHI